MITRWLNRLHMLIHLMFGLLIAIITVLMTDLSFGQVLPYAVIGSFIPDLDHFIYFFTYGRKATYSQIVRSYLRGKDWKGFSVYCASQHKYLHGLYSHTFWSVLFSLGLGFVVWRYSIQWGVFLWAIAIHFLFDIGEDLVILGRINPNWWGNFR